MLPKRVKRRPPPTLRPARVRQRRATTPTTKTTASWVAMAEAWRCRPRRNGESHLPFTRHISSNFQYLFYVCYSATRCLVCFTRFGGPWVSKAGEVRRSWQLVTCTCVQHVYMSYHTLVVSTCPKLWHDSTIFCAAQYSTIVLNKCFIDKHF